MELARTSQEAGAIEQKRPRVGEEIRPPAVRDAQLHRRGDAPRSRPMGRFFPRFLPFCLAALLPPALTGAPARPTGAATVAALHGQIETYITQPRFAGALWGIQIISLETGRVLFEHQADRRMTPASNSKLYVGALALDRLGGDYRILTPVFASTPVADGELRGDLIVSGRGDPSWKSRGSARTFWEIFDPFVAVLQAAGLKHITGDLVADATFFRGPPDASGWMIEDLAGVDGAEISALSLEDNYADLRVTPAPSAGGPVKVELLQPATGLELDNRALTGAAGSSGRIQRHRLFGEPMVHLFGAMPADGTARLIDVTVPRPATWFATAFKEALARRGIRVDGRARSVRWPDAPAVGPGSQRLGEVASPPLRELVTAFMKPSQNLETDLIFDHLGESFRAGDAPALQTSEECAVALLQDFLRRNGLPADDVRFTDGSGLSQYNLTTPRATLELLRFMATHQAAKDFVDSLPVAGVDGTLGRYLKGTPAENNLRAKTGTLRYTNALSGYVRSAAGEKLAFSIMLNRNVPPAGRRGSEEVDEIGLMLALLQGRSGEDATAVKSDGAN